MANEVLIGDVTTGTIELLCQMINTLNQKGVLNGADTVRMLTEAENQLKGRGQTGAATMIANLRSSITPNT